MCFVIKKRDERCKVDEKTNESISEPPNIELRWEHVYTSKKYRAMSNDRSISDIDLYRL